MRKRQGPECLLFVSVRPFVCRCVQCPLIVLPRCPLCCWVVLFVRPNLPLLRSCISFGEIPAPLQYLNAPGRLSKGRQRSYPRTRL